MQGKLLPNRVAQVLPVMYACHYWITPTPIDDHGDGVARGCITPGECLSHDHALSPGERRDQRPNVQRWIILQNIGFNRSNEHIISGANAFNKIFVFIVDKIKNIRVNQTLTFRKSMICFHGIEFMSIFLINLVTFFTDILRFIQNAIVKIHKFHSAFMHQKFVFCHEQVTSAMALTNIGSLAEEVCLANKCGIQKNQLLTTGAATIAHEIMANAVTDPTAVDHYVAGIALPSQPEAQHGKAGIEMRSSSHTREAHHPLAFLLSTNGPRLKDACFGKSLDGNNFGRTWQRHNGFQFGRFSLARAREGDTLMKFIGR